MMKLVAICLCACVVGSLGGTIKSKLPVVGSQGASNIAAGSVALDDMRNGASGKQQDWRQKGWNSNNWASSNTDKKSTDQDWNTSEESANSEATDKAHAWAKDASGNQEQKDASNKQGHNSAADLAAKDGDKKWSASQNQEQAQNWADKSGYRKSDKRGETISYGFDKKFERNANEDGGFNSGSALDDHSLDDEADRSSAYSRVMGDHTARHRAKDSQNADRKTIWDAANWNKANKNDKYGRNADQAGVANRNAKDWGQKNDVSNNNDRYQDRDWANARAGLKAAGLTDTNSNAKTVAYGGATAQAVLPKAYGYGASYDPTYAGKAYPNVYKDDLHKAKGVADASSLWDNSNINRLENGQADVNKDSQKGSALANQWSADQVQGFNRDNAASLSDHGYAADGAAHNQGNRANDGQWADAHSASAKGQATHDLDEVVKDKQNQKWRQSDRDHKLQEWKKFENNDQKGGQNWERLKYDRDQNDDAAAADFARRYDDANKWQNADQKDSQTATAHGANNARAENWQDRQWSQDQDAAQTAEEDKDCGDYECGNRQSWNSEAGRWQVDNNKQKIQTDGAKKDLKNQGQEAYDAGKQYAAWDNTANGGAQSGIGASSFAKKPVAGYGYGTGYGSGYGSGYGNGYGNAGYGNGYGNAGYGNGYGNAGYGNGYNKGFGGYNGYNNGAYTNGGYGGYGNGYNNHY